MGSDSGPEGRLRRVVLVGFMGSGKSTVGRLLAARLGWSFVDFDDEIERRTGARIQEIFRERGEGFFRALEEDVGRDLLGAERAVIATGGGWPAAPGRLEALGDDTLAVWLDVSAERAVQRALGGGRVRPLLAVADPVARAECLLAERAPYYRKAGLHLDATGSSPEQLVDLVLEHVRVSGHEGER